jgi:hypothetical protein
MARTTGPGEEEAMTARHHRSPLLTVCTAFMTTIGCFLGGPSAAVDAAATMSRVRSSDPSIVGLIDRASKRSPTLTRLISTVEASDGIVYVEPGRCPQRVPACLMYWMITSGSTRFMRVVVDRRRLDSDRRMAEAIGHELQHVIEVLSEPSITDGTKMLFFYGRHAPTARDYFETMAAVDAGVAVRAELRRR